MSNLSKPDYEAIIIVILGSIVGISLIVRAFRNKYRELTKISPSKQAASLLIIALVLIIISILGNSIFENQWEGRHVIEFLLLKKIGGEWFFRYMCSIGYVFIINSAAFLVISKIVKKEQ